ncbi:serine protease [Streptomyces sulfonofaciens]|uniref:Serine protease n=1 Tax=Streptomyces sulfonofaciens TaxID=68272 RepID=A0A919L5Q5_9ACTN|nr:S1 family peptidase [Streptomyces sulfonofaciens]GHH83666.1 serine protease [Streptomyces sulfonofaciens]
MSSTRARAVRTIAAVWGLLAAAVTAAPHAAAGDAGGAAARHARAAAADAAVRGADVPGTAWYTDPSTGTLVVTADGTVGTAEVARIEAAARAGGGRLEVRRAPGHFAERVAGGDAISGPGGVRCTVGFNVQDGSGVKYALTAGHCVSAFGGAWSIGPVVAGSFPGNDYALIRYTDPSRAEGGVRGPGGTLIDIVDARTPSVGESVCRSGSTTGVHCGRVTALNATVNYGGGDIVSGLIQTTVCAEPGDSGGPLYSSQSALGLTSGGSGDCTVGGTTFFQPVVEPLSAYGVKVF